MTILTFETMTQAQASAFGRGDTLHFRETDPRAVVIERADVSMLGMPSITLSAGDRSLSFRADALENGEAVTFAYGGGAYHLLQMGGSGDDVDSAYSARPRAIWTFGGADRVTLAGPGAIHAHAGSGADTVTVDNTAPEAATGDYLADGGAGDDLLDLRYATRHLAAWGGAGADRITGGSAADHLYGAGPGAPTAGDGADTIDGGSGNDYIQGNAGNDLLFGASGDDRIYGGADDDVLDGEDGNDHLQGNKGRDLLEGEAGDDVLRGGADADTLDGGKGGDLLMGDAGDDVLRGGWGLDLMWGGAGSDLFGFGGGDAEFSVSGARAGATDAIADFTRGADRIAPGYAVQAVLTAPTYHFLTIEGAAAQAQMLMQSHAGDREMVALQVGSDTLLFFASGGGNAPDAAVRLLGVDAATMTLGDFS